MTQQLKCSHEGCNCTDHLYLHSSCHPEAPPWTFIYQEALFVECSVCKKIVGSVNLEKRWREITFENLPKIGDIVWGPALTSADPLLVNCSFDNMQKLGYTMYMPITAPKPL